MTEQKELPPEQIWIDWPKKQADDAWYWTHGDYGKVEYVRVQSHKLITPETCDCDKASDVSYNVCDGGLAVCSVCGKAEAELSEPCVVQPAASTPTDPAANYACNSSQCGWVSTAASRPLSRGLKVGCPVCQGDARFVGAAASTEAQNEMPRRYCSVHQREEFKYGSLEHELHEADVDKWKRELLEAGWVAESATAWRSPDGGLYRGPYGAWIELQRQKGIADV